MRAIEIDVVSDVICPWCFLGKRRLDKAIAMLDDIKVDVNWRPFFLDPTIPKKGISRKQGLMGAQAASALADAIRTLERNEFRHIQLRFPLPLGDCCKILWM